MEHQTRLVAEDAPETFSDEGVVYQVMTSGADFTVDGLIKRFDRGDIYRPNFQRQFVWGWAQASRFIESILLGLPIPSVFLFREDESQKHLIVDGLQRLSTLHAFYIGQLPNSGRVFKLKDVKSRFEGRTFRDLEPEDQRRFEDAVIHAMVIQQASPSGADSPVYHIFDRLNTGGTPLQPQEMRSAIFHGPFQDFLEGVNDSPNWRNIFGPVHKRSKDQELVLRFLALYEGFETYEKPMTLFLNRFMEKNRHASHDMLSDWKHTFERTTERVIHALGDKPFRPNNALNVAVFDAFMIGVARCGSATPDRIQDAYQELMANEAFDTATSKATSDEKSVQKRISMVIEALCGTSVD